jgi:hypothetical protein
VLLRHSDDGENSGTCVVVGVNNDEVKRQLKLLDVAATASGVRNNRGETAAARTDDWRLTTIIIVDVGP